MLGFIFLGMQIIGVFAISVPPQQTEPVKTITIERNGHVASTNEDKLFTVSAVVDGNTDTINDDSSKLVTNNGLTKETSETDYDILHDGRSDIQSETTENGGKYLNTDISVNGALKTKVERDGVMECKNNKGNNDAVANDTPSNRNSSVGRPNVKQVVLKTLKTRSLYVLSLTIFCFSWALRFVAGLYKAYGQTFIDDDAFLALAGTLSSIFNSVGRPCWGLVMDKFGYRFTIRCISVGFAAVCATLFLTEHMHKAFFLVWICALFAMYSGVWAVSPAAFARLYGVENTSINYGFIFFTVAIANTANLVIGTTLKDVIGYHGMFFISAGLGIFPFLLTFLFNGVDADGKRI